MTQTTPSQEVSVNTDVRHPLARLTADEIKQARDLLRSAGIVGESTRFVYVGLEEPLKGDVLDFVPGEPFERRCRIMLLDTSTGQGQVVVLSLTDEQVISNIPVDPSEGQLPLLDSEFALCEEIVGSAPEWEVALSRRGLRVDQVRAVPLSAGYFGDESEIGQRIIRVVGFAQMDLQDLPWAHPVDGLMAIVDVVAGKIRHLVDDEVKTVPAERGEWDAAPHAAHTRTTLKPIEIAQPDGASFTLEDDVLEWENWKVRVGFDSREGLTLHQLSYNDQGRERSVLYRASVAEMVVAYADPSPSRFYQNYFDTGEYMFVRYTNSLELGCDCLGEIHYLDATLADENGDPQTIKNAICIHEEDYGLLWKHNDMFNGMSESRRSRRLVISFFTTIGNYDYGFYWYLYLDGMIELEAKATGVVFTSSVPSGGTAVANELAPNLGAPYHQHMFCARLDVAVDGLDNFVEERQAVRLPVSDQNPYGNSFTQSALKLKTEGDAAREGVAATGMVWHIGNSSVNNRLGDPVAYVLYSNHDPLLFADVSSAAFDRATFATKHLWVTRFDQDQRYPAGDFVNQSVGGGGLPSWIQADRDIDGQDIVLWHTFGMTHFPRPEEWPVMPMDYAGFKLKPTGFFDRNPTLDLPRSSAGGGSHCHAADSDDQ